MAFTTAQILNPNDTTVPGLLQHAQNARNLQTALTQFQTALAASDLTAAANAYNAAAGVAPNDPGVMQARSDWQKAQVAAAAVNANFQTQVTAGKTAMQAQRYNDAVTAFTAAQQLNPNDLTVAPLLLQAQNALATCKRRCTNSGRHWLRMTSLGPPPPTTPPQVSLPMIQRWRRPHRT